LERGQLFSAFQSFFKNWQQSPKVEQFFSATKMSENARVLAALDCTKHQTPISLILLEFGFKRNLVKEKDF
jgi:hypothetical protein